MWKGWLSVASFLVLTVLLPAALPVVTPRSGWFVLFSEDFESPTWDEHLVGYDEDLRSGEDYWGRTDFAFHNGSYSAGAASVGVNSEDGLPNDGIITDGTNVTRRSRYDNNMSASMDLDLAASLAYVERALGFYWAAQTEPWILDYLSVVALFPDGWHTLWSQNVTLTADFYYVNVSVPSAVRWISFHFYSDDRGSNYAGAYVDDIVVAANPGVGGTGSGMDVIVPAAVFVAAAGVTFATIGFLILRRPMRRRGT